MASRNGLNPKIRGRKGMGFGRALPAPFSFGNGIVPPGTNGSYLNISPLIGKTWPLEGCIEMWVNVVDNRAQREMEVSFNDGTFMRITAFAQPITAFEVSGGITPIGNAPFGTYVNGTKYHVAYMWDATNCYSWGNELMPNTLNIVPMSASINKIVTGVSLCGQVDGNVCTTSNMDDVRFYDRKLIIDELVQNDNSGIGNNPSTTENLFGWYQFEKFEMLDFSVLQDNSDLRLGIKDMSGMLNHAEVIGMNTDPASGGYVLKPI